MYGISLRSNELTNLLINDLVKLVGFLVLCVFFTHSTILIELQFFRRVQLASVRDIVLALADCADKRE